MAGKYCVVPITDIAEMFEGNKQTLKWVWDGYLMRGQITLLTSLWKSGKTTLLCELLRAHGHGDPFLGRAVEKGRAVVVTEESFLIWSERHDRRPFYKETHLVTDLFDGKRPTLVQWDDFLEDLKEWKPDLLVIDPLANFLPAGESRTETMLDFLERLRNYTRMFGPAILLLHHPRKSKAFDEASPRGAGVLSSYADIVVELKMYSRHARDRTRRTITATSRHRDTPAVVSCEWNPDTGHYELLDPADKQSYRDNLPVIRQLLQQNPPGLALKTMLEFWPEETGKPSRSVLHDWLALARKENAIKRDGQGTKKEPFRYRSG